MYSPSPKSEKSEMIDPEIQLLTYKRKCSVVLEILKERSAKEDVEDYISTMESLIPILNRVLTQVHNMEKTEINTIISKLRGTLQDYETTILELENSGKLKRILTSNRLRKKLDKLNSTLHKDIELFVELIIQVEVKAAEKEPEQKRETPRVPLTQSLPQQSSPSSQMLRTSMPPQNIPPPSPQTSQSNYASTNYGSVPAFPDPHQTMRIGEVDVESPIITQDLAEFLNAPPKQPFVDPLGRYASFAPLINNKNSDLFKDDWELFFGLEPTGVMAEWGKFLEFLRQKLTLNEDEEKIIRYIIDPSNTGLISKHKYTEFLKGFGPADQCIQKIKEIFIQPWFYGYLTSKESEALLWGQDPGTFLMRLSKSAPGAFALAFVYEPGKTVHILIQSNQPNGFNILDQESNSQNVFKDFNQILAFYKAVLLRPFESEIPLQNWFQGDLTGEEAVELLNGQLSGTFLIRFSSQQLGAYAGS